LLAKIRVACEALPGFEAGFEALLGFDLSLDDAALARVIWLGNFHRIVA
jgi:hypothetical protein